MNEPDAESLADYVARRFREVRTCRGWTQEEVAQRARRKAALDWARDTVAGIERGIRELTIAELVLLPVVLEEELPAFFEGVQRVHVTRFLEIGQGYLKAAMEGNVLAQDSLFRRLPDHKFVIPRGLPKSRARSRSSAAEDEEATGLFDEATQKAAARLRVGPQDVETQSLALWELSFTDERERRLQEAVEHGGHSQPSRRTLQALRGHVTRRMIAELAERACSDKKR